MPGLETHLRLKPLSSSSPLWLFLTWRPVLGGSFMAIIHSVTVNSISRFTKKKGNRQ